MDRAQLEQDINAAWEARDSINADTGGATRDAVNTALGMLDDGSARVAEPLGDHQWQVNQWLKKAVLLSFRLNDMAVIPSGTSYSGSGQAV
jgi:2,3,4,5-tetrahydropyridine-2-carboxylate N-succinyltransferase